MSLNKYPQASIRQLLAIAIPLMLSSLSGMIMMFVDRMMLIRYNLEAHNAAVEAINLSWVFIAGIIMLTGITQMFIAQGYGAGQRGGELAAPIWQMIWFCLGSVVLFWPLSIWGAPLFFGSNSDTHVMQRISFSWMLFFVPFHGLFSALSGFFIGQGKTHLPSLVTLLGNFMNMVLGYLLIFGVEGLIPPLGVLGAAIGLNASLILQVGILFTYFFRQNLNTNFNARLDLPLLKHCLTIGLPAALFIMLENLGWSCFYLMMASLGFKHLTVAGIVQNVLILFYFVGVGLSSAVATIAGNAIGANQPELVNKVVRKACLLAVGFSFGLCLALTFGCDWILGCFLDSLPAEQYQELYPALVFGLANAIIYKFLEWLRMIITGALTAAADTTFLLIAGVITIWIFMVIPVYLFVVTQEGSIELALGICSMYTLLSALLYGWRFYSGSWKHQKSLVTKTA